MGLLEDLKSGKYNLVFISILFLFVFHQYWNKFEPMSNTTDDDIKKLVELATKLKEHNSLIIPGNLTIPGKLNIGSNDNSKDLPEGVTASVEHTTGDSSIRLKTKKDDSKNIYLVNSDGNFKLKNSNGYIFGVNKDGNVIQKQNTARYIRVGNVNSDLKQDYWTLIEVRAYDRDGVNVTNYKPVQIIKGQPLDATFSAGSITDDKIYYNNNSSRTDNMNLGYHGGIGPNSLEIDLGREIVISNIVLFNRLDPRWDDNKKHYVDSRMDGTTIEFLGVNKELNRIIQTGLWHRQYSKEYVF